MAKMKKAKLVKRTNRKQNIKKFIDSNYKDISLLLKACKNDENLLIYTCLTSEELQHYIDNMKLQGSVEKQINYLVQYQPAMNTSLARFNRCVESMADYLKGYIEYNGYKLANAEGDAEDWSAEFWAKYCKICNFYRVRWFEREKLKKPSTVPYNPILYKEFIYIIRMSISGERKHLAFLATQDSNSSIFRLSIDGKLDSEKENDKTLADILPDSSCDAEVMTDDSSLNLVIDKALHLCEEYPDALEKLPSIRTFYEQQDPTNLDKKTIILGKIFLYKAGLTSPKILAFIKSLSATYKTRYNISNARIAAQLQEFKTHTKVSPKKPVKKELNWRELILHKRGEL